MSPNVVSSCELSFEYVQSIKNASDGKINSNNPGSHVAGINNKIASVNPAIPLR
jgi:hypothetical protein